MASLWHHRSIKARLPSIATSRAALRIPAAHGNSPLGKRLARSKATATASKCPPPGSESSCSAFANRLQR